MTDRNDIVADRNLFRAFAAFAVAFCFFVIAAFPGAALGQEVQGTVTDAETGDPLPGVNVVVGETTTGTSTDINGEYELGIPTGDAVLVFSAVGYATQEVPVAGRSEIDIALDVSTTALDEMVVVGYGTTERRNLTTSISSVDNVDLDQQPIGSPAEALAGRLAGVNINQSRNGLNDEPLIRVRGHSSITASNDPLVVIDGIPGGSFRSINMNDVESIEVLKDASAAAIYGSRGAGGVIIVTTKMGTAGDKPQFSFNSYAGMQYPMIHGEDAWVSGGEEYRETLEKYINREWIWEGGDPDIPMWGDDRRPEDMKVHPVVAEGDHNWESILFDPAPIQNYNLSVSGATEALSYYVSGTYQDRQGVFPHKNTWRKEYSLRANLMVDITDHIYADFRVSPRYSHGRDRVDAGIHNMIKMPPFVAPEWNEETGRHYAARDYWAPRTSAGNNPLDRVEGQHNYSNTFENIAEAKLGFDLLEGLNFESTVSTQLTYNTSDAFSERRATSINTTSGNSLNNRTINVTNENVMSYDVTLGDVHSLSSVLGASYQKAMTRYSNVYAVTDSYANEIIHTVSNAEGGPGSASSKTHWGLASYFGRVNYDYDGRYLLSASYRTDGSSRFGPENRWGVFPAASAAWVVTEESFMPDVSFLSELKLRGSYGVTGNFGINNFQYLGEVENVDYIQNGSLVQGQAQTSFSNEELQWETTESVDIGVDAGLFNDRVSIAFDYYNQQTSDLLYNVPIPSTAGFSSTMVNVGDVNNRGIEVELSTVNVTGDFNWESTFTFTRNRNEVTSLYSDVTEIVNTHWRGIAFLLREGEPMFSFYGYEMIGVHEDEASLEEHPHKDGALPGTAIYKDQNGDGVINSDDRVILGNFMPSFEWGTTQRFNWNNFDLSVAIQSKIGGSRYNEEPIYYQGATASAFLKPAIEDQWWSPDDPGSDPAASLAALTFITDTDHYLQPADYVAVRNINFGYTLPTSWVERAGVERFRLYLSVQNAFLFTSSEFVGYNPEGMTNGEVSGTGSNPGYNLGSEPLNRTIVLGVNMDF